MAVNVPASAPSIVGSGGGRALARDARVTFALLNEARYRALASAFGVSREQTNVATFVFALLVGHQLHHAWRRISGPLVDPDNDLLGTVLLKEMIGGAAGPTIRDDPQLGNLLLAAIALRGGLPLAVKTLRGIRRAGHDLDAGFRHRYGYLVDVGHVRARHYAAHARKELEERRAR